MSTPSQLRFFESFRKTLAFFPARLQTLVGFFLLLSACSTPPPVTMDAWLPEGLYQFQADFLNQNTLARITHQGNLMRVQLLGDLPGGFDLAAQRDGRLTIADADMDYPGLKRSFKGEGRISQPGRAAGSGVSWLKSAGPVSRNHRKGPWTLRPATAAEIERFEAKQADLERRRERARSATPDGG